MEKIILLDEKYVLEKNFKDAFVLGEMQARFTDYFTDFDYILGDYSYDKLRLKGFYESANIKAKKMNDIKGLDDYISNYCAFGAKYFLLKKVK